jgi:hypothetical protein
MHLGSHTIENFPTVSGHIKDLADFLVEVQNGTWQFEGVARNAFPDPFNATAPLTPVEVIEVMVTPDQFIAMFTLAGFLHIPY